MLRRRIINTKVYFIYFLLVSFLLQKRSHPRDVVKNEKIFGYIAKWFWQINERKKQNDPTLSALSLSSSSHNPLPRSQCNVVTRRTKSRQKKTRTKQQPTVRLSYADHFFPVEILPEWGLLFSAVFLCMCVLVTAFVDTSVGGTPKFKHYLTLSL